MAERQTEPASYVRGDYLNPLAKVKDFFECVSELRKAAKAAPHDGTRCITCIHTRTILAS